MLPLPRRTSPRIAAGSPQDSGLPAASASSARPHSSGPSASLGATSEPADTPSPRRLWPLPAISAAYGGASGGAAAVPSFAHRGLASAHALFGRCVPAVLRAPLVPRCALAGKVSPDLSRPRPDAAFGCDRLPHPRRPRTPANPSVMAGFPGARHTAYYEDGGVFWGVPAPPKPGGATGADPQPPRSGRRVLRRPVGRLALSHARLSASGRAYRGLTRCGASSFLLAPWATRFAALTFVAPCAAVILPPPSTVRAIRPRAAADRQAFAPPACVGLGCRRVRSPARAARRHPAARRSGRILAAQALLR